jgi:hypothetical protein
MVDGVGTGDDDRSGGGQGAKPRDRRVLSRSGRMMPLLRPPTIAPPLPGTEAQDDYDEIVVEPSVPDVPAADDDSGEPDA